MVFSKIKKFKMSGAKMFSFDYLSSGAGLVLCTTIAVIVCAVLMSSVPIWDFLHVRSQFVQKRFQIHKQNFKFLTFRFTLSQSDQISKKFKFVNFKFVSDSQLIKFHKISNLFHFKFVFPTIFWSFYFQNLNFVNDSKGGKVFSPD